MILNRVDLITCVVKLELEKLGNILVTGHVTRNDYYRKRSLHPSFSDDTIVRTVLKFRTVGDHEMKLDSFFLNNGNLINDSIA